MSSNSAGSPYLNKDIPVFHIQKLFHTGLLNSLRATLEDYLDQTAGISPIPKDKDFSSSFPEPRNLPNSR